MLKKLLALILPLLLVLLFAWYQLHIKQLKAHIAADMQRVEMLNQQNQTLKKEIENAARAPSLPPPPQSDVEAVLEPISVERNTQIDALKKRYEELLVSYLVLDACKLASSTDFHVITSALSQEMASMNAPGRLQYDILTSARGSYQELYSGNHCNPDMTTPLHKDFQAYIAATAISYLPQ